MDVILKDLTPSQTEAVTHTDGPLLILAGPGSGKTRVITHRIAHMVEQGVPPRSIAALTFTNKASKEMQERLEKLVPGRGVWMGTFHRFCAQLLRHYATMVGLSENYSIYDTSDAKQALKRAIEVAALSKHDSLPTELARTISNAKNRLVTPEMLSENARHADAQLAARVYSLYQQQLLTANAVDFDDLLFHIAMLLKQSPEMRRKLDHRFRYILVDEYQDTNLAQYSIVRALSIDYPNLAVTGDPDQSIYGWRGADLNNILDFEKDYPTVKVVRLEQNYRSTPNILRAADQLIRHNRRRKQKDLFTDNLEGEQVVLRFYPDGYKEADGIVEEILNRIRVDGYRPRDFAILCRMNALTRSLEHSLRRNSLPYQIVNGVEFYQRKEIKDLLAYLHLINNPAHDVALQRTINTPPRGIGATTLKRLRNFADVHRVPMLEAARQAHQIDGLAKRAVTSVTRFVELYDRLRGKATEPIRQILSFLVKETKYEEFLERDADEHQDSSQLANVDELITAASEFDMQHPDDGSLDLFLEQVSLVADTDAFEQTEDCVTLMTLHASKGLEFPCIYVIGVEDGLLPHARSQDSDASYEEERRLLFVGITRAKERLQLSCCKRRTTRGDTRVAIPSPFLNELPLAELRKVEAESENDWLDDDLFDEEYPEVWDSFDDEADNGSIVREKILPFRDKIRRRPEPEPTKLKKNSTPTPPKTKTAASKRSTQKAKPQPVAGLKTAAEMLSEGSTPLTVYREGTQVRHGEYGKGTVVSITGFGPKRTARIRFDDGEHHFRLAFADLEVLDS